MLFRSVKTAKTLWDTVITILDIEHSALLYISLAFGLGLREKVYPNCLMCVYTHLQPTGVCVCVRHIPVGQLTNRWAVDGTEIPLSTGKKTQQKHIDGREFSFHNAILSK